jgi:hypothetical protein
MDLKAPVTLIVTTYELTSESQYKPTLSHSFYGDNITSVLGVAKSHLKTDEFFRASFEEEMPWRSSFLRLSNNGVILGEYPYKKTQDAEILLNALAQEARRLGPIKEELGILQQIEILSRE